MANTTKGYPYPLGTDRVMDGDNVIKALAEAIDSDANWTRAPATTGGSVTGAASNPVLWDAATVNGCALTKTSTSVWTTTKAGIYVVSVQVQVSGFQASTGRSYGILTLAGGNPARVTFNGENQFSASLVQALAVGDTIKADIFPNATTTIASGFLNVARLGRT